MKTIVDTCVWSLALRRSKFTQLSLREQQSVTDLKGAIQDNRVAIIGPIRQEVLSGIRDKTEFNTIQQLLDPFRDEEIVPTDYIDSARLFNLCSDQGVQCGPIDILICAVASRLRFGISTSDKSLLRCIEVLRLQRLVI